MTTHSNAAHLRSAPGVTIDMIVDLVCDRMDRSRADVIGGDERSQQTLRARHIVMWLARRLTLLPHAEIGRQIGGRDGGVVMNAEARINALRAVEYGVARDLAALDLELRCAGATVERTGLGLRASIDAVAVARRIQQNARAATQVSTAEIEALCAFVVTHARVEPSHV